MATPHLPSLARRPARHRIALAVLALGAPAWAAAQSTQALEPVTVTGRVTPTASVAGWGSLPPEQLPLQATVLGSEQLKDLGAGRLADLTRVDASIADSYNTTGYWDYLRIRGFVIDNRYNFRRDGLPISAETSIPLDNKESVVVLKGTSGMQAGTSAPGGLVDLVVKRPLEQPLRRAGLDWQERGTVTATLDLSDRFGADRAFGLRVNAALAALDPKVDDARGDRRLLALAADWRLSPDTLIEAEIETSRLKQPSVPGFSLRGDAVPAPVDPRLNLNNQDWSLPGVFDANTASLRWKQKFDGGWLFTLHGATQRLRSDDRIAFPFGLDCNETSSFEGTYYCDRFGPDGRFDLYDYRSENERRRSDALDASLQGEWVLAGMRHHLTAGVLLSRMEQRFQDQAYNFTGIATDDGQTRTEPNPALLYANTNRDERSTEWYARDAIRLNERWTAWLGARQTTLRRKSYRTDPNDLRATDVEQRFITPFAALSYAVVPGQLLHASWGRGVESAVAPNRPRYANAGEAFAAKSRQAEFGWRGEAQSLRWDLAYFDILQPQYEPLSDCSDAEPCRFDRNGSKRHRGVEAQGSWSQGPWTLEAGAMWLRARFQDRSVEGDTPLNGQQPDNTPQRTLKTGLDYRVASAPGLSLRVSVVHESQRRVIPGESLTIPGWTRVDMAARYRSTIGGHAVVWRAGIDNLADKRAWRESPYQFEHVYLFPMPARTFRVGMQVDL